MPQDTSTTYYFNAEGDTVPSDSIAADMLRVIDSISALPVQEPYYEKSKPGDDGLEGYIPLFIGMFMIAILAYGAIRERQQEEEEGRGHESSFENDAAPVRTLVYDGSELHFSDDEMVKVLHKYFPYYSKLGYEDKLKFFHRLKNFISEKTFVIHDESGFKEMPILISASAVQLSFGLDKYLLPHFPHIHIFPEEFIGYHPTIRLLEGNVSNHSINLSWKHFLNGYKLPENGQNVGLHEFAHAFYYQYFEARENVEWDFVETFPLFDACGNKAFEAEKLPGNKLYSDYALTSFQEFWAESIEIFFERPADMQTKYAELYAAMCEILNQDPLKNLSSLT